jgi:hypothetical protein
MARPATDNWYRERIATLAQEGYKAAAIGRLIEMEALDAGRTDCPQQRTVYRLYQEHLKQPEHVRREQALFRWPDAMTSQALPWEASRAALDLLRLFDQSDGKRRPTIRHAKWFWRLRMAAPDLHIGDANYTSAVLAAGEYAKLASVGRAEIVGLDRLLAYQPWRTDEDQLAYADASARNGEPAFTRIDVSGSEADHGRIWRELTT